MNFPLTLGQYLWAAGLIWTAATIQGAMGFGLALIAAPLLLMTVPMLVPGPLICISLVLMSLVCYRDFHSVDRPGLVWGTLGRLPGSLLAGVVMGWLPTKPLNLLFASLIFFAVILSSRGWRVPMNRWSMVIAGALSGLMGTISSVGGPPVALLYQHHTPSTIRGTIAGHFLIGGALSLVVLVVMGRFGMDELLVSAALFPSGLLGFFCSGPLITHMQQRHLRVAILWFAGVSSVVAMLRELW